MICILFLLPLVGSDAKIDFYFFSKEYPIEKLQLNETNINLVNTLNPVKFIIHGWGESSERLYYHHMTDAYLLRGDYNVIQVDWKELAGQLYLAARTNTKLAGAAVGKMIIKLKESGVPLENVHVIGHSLGSHVSGFAGKWVFGETGHKIRRISALDPAGPGFVGVPPKERLCNEDAEMVDVTHTDIGYNGYEKPLGTIDFYANGGHRPQPGCEPFKSELYKMDPLQIAFCSHTRSYHYFIDAINNNDIIATKCANYKEYLAKGCENNEKIIYGEDAPFDDTGVYYFRTNNAAPYAFKE